MRPSCLFCATKHLSQALILLSESVQGYPNHRWLTYGHMAEASDELIQQFPHVADLIREERKRLETGRIDEGRTSSLMALIAEVTRLMDPVPVMTAPPEDLMGTGPYGAGKDYLAQMPESVFAVEDGDGTRVLHVPIDISGTTSFIPPPGTFHTPAKTSPPCTPCEAAKKMEAERVANELAAREAKLLDDNVDVIEPEPLVSFSFMATEASFQRELQHAANGYVGKEPTGGPQIIILTTLNDFNPSYSLSTCIKDQALALANAGFQVRLIVQEHCRFTADDVPGVSIEPTFPSCVWKEDEIVPGSVDSVLQFLYTLITDDPTVIISHDLLFQSWFVSAAKAIHLALPLNGPHIRWFHVAHSSVGTRPQTASDQVNPIYWRTNVPMGHQLVCLNSADQLWFDQWYGVEPGHTKRIRNIRDPRTAWGMRPEMLQFVTQHRLLDADVVCLFPLSLPRWQEKRLLLALDFFADVVKRLRDSVPNVTARFVIVAAHANDTDLRLRVTENMDARAEHVGLTPREVVYSYEHFIGEEWGPGLGRADMDILWRLSNLFIFPTISEAGSLVLLEAQSAGCVMALNRSVPGLDDYVIDDDAVSWVSWGSQKSPVKGPDFHGYGASVLEVAQRLHTSPRKPKRLWRNLAQDWIKLIG